MNTSKSPCSKNCDRIIGSTSCCRVCKLTQKELDVWPRLEIEAARDILRDLKNRKIDDPLTIGGGYADA